MSRTFRKPSQNKSLGVWKMKKVRDGTMTHTSKRCENNGGCSYCKKNRLHKHLKWI